MKEKLLLISIEKSYINGKKEKCIRLMKSYFKNRYNISKLLTTGVEYEFYLKNVKSLADNINESYNEKEISVFADFGLIDFVQKLLDNNWGSINKGILLCYVPSLINYNNLNGIPYNILYDLYEKKQSDDILRKFNEEIDVVHALNLYKSKKENINLKIKYILLIKFYESENYINYYNELNEKDKELFINNLILKNKDVQSIERAYHIFLMNNKRSLYNHIMTYDTGMYTYYLLKECRTLSKDDINDLTNKLEKCEDKQYKLFYTAYSYKNNPAKLASQVFTPVGGITLFFMSLEAKCTNIVELVKLKKLYEDELKNDKDILIQKINSIKINDGFNFAKTIEDNEIIDYIHRSIQKEKGSKA